MLFFDRRDAGKHLANRLASYKQAKDTLVLGIARGGILVAKEVAEHLFLPLDVITAVKLGAPHNEELALGALTASGELLFNEQLMGLLQVTRSDLKKEIEKQTKEVQERKKSYRTQCPAKDLEDKIIILIDDGIATGATARAAIASLHTAKAHKIILAIPVIASETFNLLSKMVDSIVCLSKPAFFASIGAFYQLFNEVSDQEIIHLLAEVSSRDITKNGIDGVFLSNHTPK